MSVSRLTRENHNDVLELFGNETENYYFLINDLLENNYNAESFYVYGEYQKGKLVSFLLNNFKNITYYSKTIRNVTIYRDLLDSLSYDKLSGPSDLMAQFKPFVKLKCETLSHLGVIKKVTGKRKYQDLDLKTVATEEEISMLYNLFSTTEEYRSILPKNKKTFVEREMERLENNHASRTVYLRGKYEILASAATVRESTNSAIIIGVCTNSKFRNKGFGSEVLIGLFNRLLEEGKFPYLFYTNPNARSVYKNLGMVEVCEWRVIEII